MSVGRSGVDAAVRRALEEAEKTSSSGDVPVGAVVLDPDGVVIGAGHNEREATGDPTAHAEVLALRAAARRLGSWRLSGCTLAVTLNRARCARAPSCWPGSNGSSTGHATNGQEP